MNRMDAFLLRIVMNRITDNIKFFLLGMVLGLLPVAVYHWTNQAPTLVVPAVETPITPAPVWHVEPVRPRAPESEWPARFMYAIKQVESGGDPNAESPAGARGFYQIMRPTWEEWSIYPWDCAFDPIENELVASQYIRWLRQTLHDWTGEEPHWSLVAAAWNGGIGRLRSVEYNIDGMPTETRNFVRKIHGALESNQRVFR